MAEWFNDDWKRKAIEKWNEWDKDKEDTSAYWAEKIPNIDKLEKMTNAEVVAIVAPIYYPGASLDYRENVEIGEIHRVLTYFRTVKMSLGKFRIGPNIRGTVISEYKGKLEYDWDTHHKYEEWDWDDANDPRDDKYGNATNRINDKNEITRRYNFFGAPFDEYPLFMAARKNAEKAILRSFIIEDYMKEELPARVKKFVDGLAEKRKVEAMYKYVIDEIVSSEYLNSLSEDQLVGLLGWLTKDQYRATSFANMLNNQGIWELYKTPQVFREVIQLAHVKAVMKE